MRDLVGIKLVNSVILASPLHYETDPRLILSKLKYILKVVLFNFLKVYIYIYIYIYVYIYICMYI